MLEGQVDPVTVVLGTGRPGTPEADDKTYLSEDDGVFCRLRPISFLQRTLDLEINNADGWTYLHLIELSLLSFMYGSIGSSLQLDLAKMLGIDFFSIVEHQRWRLDSPQSPQQQSPGISRSPMDP